MKKFLKIEVTKLTMRGEASGDLQTWLLFLAIVLRTLALPLILGFGLEFLHGAPILWV